MLANNPSIFPTPREYNPDPKEYSVCTQTEGGSLLPSDSFVDEAIAIIVDELDCYPTVWAVAHVLDADPRYIHLRFLRWQADGRFPYRVIPCKGNFAEDYSEFLSL